MRTLRSDMVVFGGGYGGGGLVWRGESDRTECRWSRFPGATND